MNRILFSLLIVMFLSSFNQAISFVGQNSLKNVTIIGGLTNGSTGTPMFFDLPGGGQFRLCTINTSLSGAGVEPDIIVTRTIRGIAEGKDEILEAALKYLRTATS